MTTLKTENQSVASTAPTVWQNRNYMILYFTGALLTLGGKVYELALPLILYNLSQHSAIAMTTMRAIEFLPNLSLALFIGVWVDRVDKKRWVTLAVAVQTVLLILLYSLHRVGVDSLWTYYVTGFLLMASQYAYGNGRVSIVKQALPHELLTPANANFSFVTTLVGICGPAISGFLFMLSDLHTGLLITAIAYACGLVLTSRLQTEQFESQRQRNSTFRDDLRAGWQTLRQNQALWQITMLVIFLNATMGMVDAMTVFVAKDRLVLPNSTLGLVLAVEGVGGLVGARLVAWCRMRFGTGQSMGVTVLLLSGCFGVLAFTHDVTLFAIALLGIGVFSSIQNICIWTFRQESTPQEMIGRVTGLTGSLFKLGMVWTIFGSGWLTQWAGPGMVYVVACVGNLVVYAVYVRLPLRGLR